MRIFLTGATGHVGGAVLEALLRGGHTITALVRDSEKAERVAARGAHPVIGNLGDIESFRGAAEAQDGSSTPRFESVFRGAGPPSRETGGRRDPRRGEAPAYSRRRASTSVFVIFTSGLSGARQGAGSVDCGDAPDQSDRHLAAHRPAHEELVLKRRTDPLRTMVIRPGHVYGGGVGVIGDLFKAANNGLVRVVGDGSNHWPLVYERDLADLYMRMAVHQDATGDYHANDEGDERVNDIV